MSVTVPPRPPRPGDPVDREELEALVEALIEEARQRARRRRRIYTAVAALVALAGVAVFTVFERSAQSQTASRALAAQPSRPVAAAESRIAFMTAGPRLPNGLQWHEVYVMNADGSGQRNLTRNPAGDGHPVWSPDGKKIGFVSNRGGNRDIYVVNADGSELRNLTRDVPRQAFALAWSPAQK